MKSRPKQIDTAEQFISQAVADRSTKPRPEPKSKPKLKLPPANRKSERFLVTLPAEAADQVRALAERRSEPFATTVRNLVVTALEYVE